MKNPARLAVLKKFEHLLDSLIAAQREEQECILNREINRLPDLSQRIEQLGAELEKMQWEIAPVRDTPAADRTEEQARRVAREKFLLMQELTMQNAMLLDNMTKFLNRMMVEFLGSARKPTVYNQAGAIGKAFASSGILVDVKV